MQYKKKEIYDFSFTFDSINLINNQQYLIQNHLFYISSFIC